MTTKVELFDCMLNVTAELFFNLEKELFWHVYADRPGDLLDIGCGNGAYLSKLHTLFPSMQLTGLETEEGIFRRALAKQTPGMKFRHGSFEDLPAEAMYDIVVARLVMAHIRDRRQLYRWLQAHTHAGAAVIVLDVEEDELDGIRLPPLFTALYRSSRKAIRKRSLLRFKDSLRLELEAAGFRHDAADTYAVHTGQTEVRERLYRYMRLVTESLLGTPLSAEREYELDVWRLDPNAHLEIRMFGMTFTKQELLSD
ncbi:class I SAM-dependent methyltransferase [Paenibacillus sp. MBLB4367]|uniref:class I SAM-dependent methyltransferase n=1 Tax=Paenibacillus sp. MBLB4367 TaxID=3384767 RepID=UPI0039081F4C